MRIRDDYIRLFKDLLLPAHILRPVGCRDGDLVSRQVFIYRRGGVNPEPSVGVGYGLSLFNQGRIRIFNSNAYLLHFKIVGGFNA
jgi:hypothetical protein